MAASTPRIEIEIGIEIAIAIGIHWFPSAEIVQIFDFLAPTLQRGRQSRRSSVAS